MLPAVDPIIRQELPAIARIIDDETWLEGERRGCFVSPNDPIVRENVCEVVLRVGAELRDQSLASLGAARGEAAA